MKSFLTTDGVKLGLRGVLLVAAACVLLPAFPAQAQVSYTNKVMGSNGHPQCLSVSGGRIANSTPLIIWDCVAGGDLSQTFFFAADGTMRIGPANSQFCVAAYDTVKSGTRIGVWQCAPGNPTQRIAAGMYSNLHFGGSTPDLCLGTTSGAKVPGTTIIGWNCTNASNDNQSWTAARVGAPPPPAPATPPPAVVSIIAFHLISGLGSRCLAVQNASTAGGARLVIWACQDSSDQMFSFASDGSIRPYGNAYGNYCLDIQDPKGDSRTMVAGDHPQLWQCNGGQNQKFTFSGGTIKTANGLVLDVWGGAPVSWFSGAVQVQLANPNGGNNQRFVAGITVPAGQAHNSISPDTQANIVPLVFSGSIVSHNGSAILGNSSSGLLPAGANIVATGAGNLMSDGSGHIVATGAGNIVATGAGNVIVPVASGVVAQGAGN